MNAKKLQESKAELEGQLADIKQALEAINRILGASPAPSSDQPIIAQLGVTLRPSTTIAGCKWNISRLDKLVEETNWSQHPPKWRQLMMERRNSEAWKLRKLQRKEQ